MLITEKTNAPSNKEELKIVYERINDAKEQIISANTEEQILMALDSLAAIMAEISCNTKQEIRESADDINDIICSVRIHDLTRGTLLKTLDSFLNKIESIIEERTSNQNVAKLRSFFLACAKHAEEIAEIIDITSIFGS